MVKQRSLSAMLLLGAVALWGAVLVAGLSGCTEDGAGPADDTEGPELRVLFPPDRVDDRWVVSDSTYVYVGARDETGIAEVEVWFSRPSEAQRRLIGSTSSTYPISQVPDSVSSEFTLPDGFSLYRVRWGTLNINSGTFPQLFATASDPAGNEARSDIVTVRILNLGQDLVPPVPEFTISPPSGTVEFEFCFDPSATEDNIDNLEDIQVRWDFEGDGVWDLDWDALLFADDLVYHTYVTPRIYRPRLQARNSYIPEQLSEIRSRDLSVAPAGGRPVPPNPEDFFTLRAGDYPRGAAQDPAADLDEYPLHTVRLSDDVQIQRIETTNQLYLDYLLAELNPDSATIVFQNNEIRALIPVLPADTLDLYCDLLSSRIFFNVDTETFEIEPGFADHPVTGVTWFGANAYAFKYGLRLLFEGEWEAAARGDSLFFRYPYGRDITDGDPTGMMRVNYVTSGDPFEGNLGTTPVMYYNGQSNPQGFETIDSPSWIGIYDLSGNVAEWVNDWYAGYSSQQVQTNPQGPADGVFKVVRGGSYLGTPDAVRVSARDGDRTPSEAFSSIGFRVAFIDFDNAP